MKQWILEKEGQLKLFSCFFILILLSTQISWADKIIVRTDENGNKVYENLKEEPKKNIPKDNRYVYHQNPQFTPIIIPPQKKPPQLQTPAVPQPEIFNPAGPLAAICTGVTLCGFFWILLPIIFLTVWIISLIDIVKNEFTGSNKIIWVLVISFVPLIGSILYWTMGEKQKIHIEKSADNSTSEKRKYKTPKL